jgi:hypothetical protein
MPPPFPQINQLQPTLLPLPCGFLRRETFFLIGEKPTFIEVPLPYDFILREARF